MTLISRSEAAKRMGVTVQAVYGAIKEGRLTGMTDENGKVFVESDTLQKEWVNKSKFQRVRKKPKAVNQEASYTSDSIPDYDESKARNEFLKGELLEIERKQLEQTLVLAEDVNLKWQKIVNTVRNKLLGVPSKAQQQLPDLDDSAINTLDSIIREALEELARV